MLVGQLTALATLSMSGDQTKLGQDQAVVVLPVLLGVKLGSRLGWHILAGNPGAAAPGRGPPRWRWSHGWCRVARLECGAGTPVLVTSQPGQNALLVPGGLVTARCWCQPGSVTVWCRCWVVPVPGGSVRAWYWSVVAWLEHGAGANGLG